MKPCARLSMGGVALALTSLLTGTAADASSSTERSLHWAERLLAQTPVPPTQADPGSRWDVWQAREAFNGIISSYGPTARGYMGLGQSQVCLGDYAMALRSFARARRLKPGSRSVRKAYQEARQRVLVTRAVSTQIPHGQQVVQALPIPGRSRQRLWAVLCALAGSPGENQTFGDPHLILFQMTRGGCRKLWQSHALLGRREKGEEIAGNWDEVALKVADFTGDGVPEVDDSSWLHESLLQISKRLNALRLTRRINKYRRV